MTTSETAESDAAALDRDIEGLLALYQRGRFAELVREGESLAARHPHSVMLYNLIGAAAMALGAFAEAENAFHTAVSLEDGHAELFNNLGAARESQGKFDEAIAAYGRALALDPAHASALYNRGNALRKLQSLPEAVACYERALALRPDYAEAHNNLGLALQQLRAVPEAVACYQRAIALRPDFAEAYNNLGLALQRTGETVQAIQHFRQALALKPDYAEAFQNIATTLADLKQFDGAVQAFDLALAIDPGNTMARLQKAFVQMRLCDFSAVRELPRFEAEAGQGGPPIPPWMLLAFADDPERQLRCSQQWARAAMRPLPVAAQPLIEEAKPRIRLGYFSADFHCHATLHLMAGLFREHDRQRFEIIAYSYGDPNHDDSRAQLVGHVDRFVDIRDLSDGDAIAVVRGDALDIAVDLKGYTEQSRSHLFASRLAPVQINYLGYPGSMGSEAIDYLIADPVIVPPGSERFYSENIIYLPGSYQPNDDRRPIAESAGSRADYGLPRDGFVFCGFHQGYKVGPDEFALWLRLLARVPGSVLWLLKSNVSFEISALLEANLQCAAEAQGIDPRRLVFAPCVPHAEHLARLKHADLFLDTFNVNAHTTASDALWAGVPFVTKAGRQFAARVGASLLHAIGLPELVTGTEAGYEALAADLATQPERLAAIRARLAENRLTAPLFDTRLYARKLESGYAAALQRHRDGLAPAAIVVD